MLYSFYMKKILLPVTPSKLKLNINGNNQTINLINEGEVNQIKISKLTDIEFECILPQIIKYPFARYKDDKFKTADYFLDEILKMKNLNKPFKFKVVKAGTTNIPNIGVNIPRITSLFETDFKVTLEKYTITEDSKNGTDIMVSITLKQYRNYKTKRLERKANSGEDKVVEDKAEDKTINKSCTVKKGDTLSIIAKRELNSSSRASEIYNLNKNVIEEAARKYGRKSSSNGHWIYPGTKLKLPKG